MEKVFCLFFFFCPHPVAEAVPSIDKGAVMKCAVVHREM